MTTIRRLSLADAATVHSLRLAVDGPGPLGSPLERAQAIKPEQIASDLSAPGYVSFGAFKLDQSLIGTAFIAPTPDAKDWFSLFGIAVSPESRGSGVGRTLTQACLSHAANHGAEGYLLHVNVPNPAAKSLYDSLGFEVWSTAEGVYSHEDIRYTRLTMRKPLGRGDAV